MITTKKTCGSQKKKKNKKQQWKGNPSIAFYSVPVRRDKTMLLEIKVETFKF